MAVMDSSYYLQFARKLAIACLYIILCIASGFASAEEPATPDQAADQSTSDITEQSEPAIADPFSTAVEELKQSSFKKKGQAIEQLQSIDDPRVLNVFKYLLGGDLYYRKEDKRVVLADKKEGEYNITDAISGEELGTTSKSALKKIIANNRMRKQLRGAIAQLSLGSKDASVRLLDSQAPNQGDSFSG